MKAIGKILRTAREERGLSLDDAHKAIKIQEKYLSAIENGNMSVFLAEIYYKTFMKSYAKYLGLDAEILAKQYEEGKREDGDREISEPAQGMFSRSVDKKKTSKKEKDAKEKSTIDTTKLLVTLLIAVCLLAGFIYLNKNISDIISENSNLHEDFVSEEQKDDGNIVKATEPDGEKKPDNVSVAVPVKKEEAKPRASLMPPAARARTMPVQPALPAAISVAKQEPVKPGNQQSVASPSSRQPEVPVQARQSGETEQIKPKAEPVKQKLAIEAVENVWIRVESDGREVFQGTVIKGSQKEWKADTAFVLKVGYTPGIKVLFNGESVDIVKGSIQDVNTVVLKRQ